MSTWYRLPRPGQPPIPSPQGHGRREGFTTGTAATAAAMAALQLLLSGHAPPSLAVPMPPPATMPLGQSTKAEQDEESGHGLMGADAKQMPDFLSIPIEECRLLPPLPSKADQGNTATKRAVATVRKDGGDDPDATHNAAIVATVTLSGTALCLEGGEGVGRVTLPGLPLPVGEWAINPAPRRQMAYGLELTMRQWGYKGGVHVVISVPQGELIARHTFNPRLGIVGGISILGTQGTVRPFSHAAWKATIVQGLNVAAATGCQQVCLATGRRSERLLLDLYPALPPQAAIQAADFAAFSLREAATRPFVRIAWGCFFGKLVKLAQGHAHTHAHSADLDFALLARWCAEAGAFVPGMDQCITASHALELLLPHASGHAALQGITQRAANVAAAFAGRRVNVHLFHLNGAELHRAEGTPPSPQPKQSSAATARLVS